MKKALLLSLASLLSVFLFTGCQKDLKNPDTPGPNNPPPPATVVVDDSTQVTATVSGVVLDENNRPAVGATVRCGNQSQTTNTIGVFFFRNIALSKNNGSVSVTKTGYFKGTRNFLVAAGKSHFIRLKLIKEVLSATLPAATGGTVDLGSGALIVFPANAFAYPNGTPVSGNVRIYGKYLNPTDPALHLTVPGDLRGIRGSGREVVLCSYGMIGAELFDDNGQPVVIAGGKNASLEFPVPAAVQPAIGDSIPLWHFNEGRARWLEDGVARKSGGKMRAAVSHFSFWNIDDPYAYVPLSCVVMNATDSTPVANQLVQLTIPGTSVSSFGYTSYDGYVYGGVPAGQPLEMTIEATNSCGSILHTRTIGPFSAATALDTVWITLPRYTYTMFTGTIKNCQGGPASPGYIYFYSPTSGSYILQADSATGSFTLPVYGCQNATLSYSYLVYDFGSGQQSDVVSGTASTPAVNLGDLVACAAPPPPPPPPVTTPDVYVFGDEKSTVSGKQVIKYWKNGLATDVTDGSSICYSYDATMTTGNAMYVAGIEYDAAGTTSMARLWVNGVKTDISGSSFVNSTASGVFVNGSDVYVCYSMQNLGTGYSTARLWKNGVRTVLADSAVNFYPSCVYVAGTDVYVGGSYTPRASTVARAVIWKNGVAQYLNGSQLSSQVNKVLVVGSDVYAVGQDATGGTGRGRAVIWKNGVPTYLTDGSSSDAMANNIFVAGSDVYVCGRQSAGSGEKAMLWKNGVPTQLTPSGSNGIAKGLFVKNGDVYVSEVSFMSGPLRLWKNNLASLLTTGNNFNSVNAVIVP